MNSRFFFNCAKPSEVILYLLWNLPLRTITNSDFLYSGKAYTFEPKMDTEALCCCACVLLGQIAFDTGQEDNGGKVVLSRGLGHCLLNQGKERKALE